MKQTILDVPIPETPESDTAQTHAGVMYEHNAAALRFLLPEVFCTAEYRCYAEFVTARGTARTDYLEPNENREILLSLPLEITAQMTALCVFQVVKIGENGTTEQKITAKTLRLYFSPLQNTEKLLDVDHAFSVNMLLEAIRRNTFKGDKGDKGDAYALTQDDRAEIAVLLSEQMYGLPLVKTQCAQGYTTLPGAVDSAQITGVCVRPRTAGQAIPLCMVAFGENLLAPMLDSKKYNLFEPVTSAISRWPLYLEPNTSYTLTRKDAELTENCTSSIVVGTSKIYFCHRELPNSNRQQISFTTDATGLAWLESTRVMISEERYADILSKEWEGLTLLKTETGAVLHKTFDAPLLAASAEYADSYDFATGTTVRRTFSVQLTADMCSGEPLTLTSGDITVYRYCLPLPDGITMAPGVLEGFCADMETMPKFFHKSAEYNAFVQAGGPAEGIFFGAVDNALYVYSKLDSTAFSAWLRERTEAGNPITAICCRQAAEVSVEPCEPIPSAAKVGFVEVTPRRAQALCTYRADISAVANDFESRIAGLENNI